MSTVDLSIDLGSKFITIYQKGVGLVLREPAIAIASRNKSKFEIREAGFRAQNIMTGALGGAKVIAPINKGIVVDEEMAAQLLQCFLKKILPHGLIKPRVRAIVSICSSSTGSERQAVEKSCIKAGIKEVTLVESPLSLLSYTSSIGGLFVDIGGGKTEISAVTNRGIICGCTVDIAGDAFNNAIIDFIVKKYGVRLGEFTVEHLKQSALSFYINDNANYAVSGAAKDAGDAPDGSPRSLYVSASDLLSAVQTLVDDLIELMMDILDKTPPELSAEILRKGIFVSGGSMHIPGIADYLEQALELPVTALKDIDNAVAIGGARFFDNKDMLSDMLGVKLNLL